MTQERLRPARPVAPGRILRRELEARGWTQEDFAHIIGRPTQTVNQIVQGKKRITPETAIELAEAFGMSADFWSNLEAAYRLQLAEGRERGHSIERKSKLYAVAPVREIIKREWVVDAADERELERRVLDFLGLASLDEPLPQAANFRCSPMHAPDERALYAWTRRVDALASLQSPARYSRERLEAGIPAVLALARRPEQVRDVPAALMQLGVRCVVVPRLERTYADGAALHATERPVVALTLRLDRIDNFWFTLMHELAHLVLGHEGSFIDDTGDADCVRDAREKRADKLASDWLVPPVAYRRFLLERGSRYPLRAVEEFAENIGRHPGIVVGRLHFEGKLSYKYLRQTLAKVSPYLQDRADRPMPSQS